VLRDIRAELIKQRHRPACWLLLATAAVLVLTFAYLIPYAGYTGTSTGGPGSERGLAAMLPEAFVGGAVAGLPIFAGALALIFGVLVTGGEYGWETWKTVLIQHPSRLAVYGAKLAALAVGALVFVVTLFAVTAGASLVVAALEDQPASWPAPGEIALGVAAAWLITTMWAALGALLGIAFRGVALPIGLGLVWMLAVQNLLASLAAPLLDWVAELQKVLPGPNVGSLSAALGAPSETPGVDAIVGSGQAVGVVAAYLVTFGAAGAWLLHRRDIV
jgi:ABC-2 type transport system permease protein